MTDGALRVPLSRLAPGERALEPEAAHYVLRVRRLRPGARLVVFDPEARTEADATLVGDGRPTCVMVGEIRQATAVPKTAAILVQCVGKGSKLDQVVRDATELGASAILAALSERSVAQRTSPGALERLRRIAVEAARQSRRGDVPRIEPPRPLREIARPDLADVRVVLDPSSPTPLYSVLGSAEQSHAFVVGPEGGLSGPEVRFLTGVGFAPARLGRFVLRTETVAAAALGAWAALCDGSAPGRV
jgi:16S rRNA (uracil1498-N3)-methyltransferase